MSGDSEPTKGDARRVSRRAMLGWIGAAGAGAAGAVVGSRVHGTDRAQASAAARGRSLDPGAGPASVAFYGAHQAGVATPVQAHLCFAALDLVHRDPSRVRDTLKAWTAAAARMTQGGSVPGSSSDARRAPADTGEALDLPASRLTVTIGFGPSLFAKTGLSWRRPGALADLPAFATDRLDPSRSGGDLCIQACADDPQVAYHAVRDLVRLASGTAPERWMQFGFGKAAATSIHEVTPRNLMGFRDGTDNIKIEDAETLDDDVWVGAADDPAWMAGGTYLVARRIEMRIERWDASSLGEQERVFGRAKATGAPLGGRAEDDPVDLTARTATGDLVIARDAHIRLASPRDNGGVRILRRGYNFAEGVEDATKRQVAGLFFLAYQRDPRTHFVPIQRRLSASDALNEYIAHTGSAVFAIPPGTRAGGYVGETLFEP